VNPRAAGPSSCWVPHFPRPCRRAEVIVKPRTATLKPDRSAFSIYSLPPDRHGGAKVKCVKNPGPPRRELADPGVGARAPSHSRYPDAQREPQPGLAVLLRGSACAGQNLSRPSCARSSGTRRFCRVR